MMETTTQQIAFQLMMLILSGILAMISAYVKKYLETKVQIAQYGFDNERIERIIGNAVSFAEQKGASHLKQYAEKIAGNEKLDFAKQYIDTVDKSIIEKYGGQLDMMIERKINQTILGK